MPSCPGAEGTATPTLPWKFRRHVGEEFSGVGRHRRPDEWKGESHQAKKKGDEANTTLFFFSHHNWLALRVRLNHFGDDARFAFRAGQHTTARRCAAEPHV